MISAVVLTKDEEKNILDCVETLEWCDEVIVVDDYSKDRTVEVIRNMFNKKIKVFKRRMNGDFSKQRNFALSKTKGDWVLFVDADERVSEALFGEILNLIPQIAGQISNKYNGYFIKRTDVMWGKQLKYGETGNIRFIRLAKKEVGEWEGKIHEKWKVKEPIGELKNPLIHYPHQSIAEFLQEINFYTDLRAEELYNSHATVNWTSILTYPLGKFIYNFFIKRGILDEVEGFVFAIMMSFHSFLVRSKLWLLWQKN